jgi:hypothetical protein
MEDIKSIIIEIINEYPGINSPTLSLETMSKIYKSNMGENKPYIYTDYFFEVVKELVTSQEIIEVEYIVPTINQISSVYFPKGTKINVIMPRDIRVKDS